MEPNTIKANYDMGLASQHMKPRAHQDRAVRRMLRASGTTRLSIPSNIESVDVQGWGGCHRKYMERVSRAEIYVKMGYVFITGPSRARKVALELMQARIRSIDPSIAIAHMVVCDLAKAEEQPSTSDEICVEIPIPHDVPVGHIIGKGKRNLLHIRQVTGAYIAVSRDGGALKVCGSESAVESAREILVAQFLARQQGRAMPYAHSSGKFVLGDGLSVCKQITFVQREQKTSSCMLDDHPGFEIVPADLKLWIPLEECKQRDEKLIPFTRTKLPAAGRNEQGGHGEIKLWSELASEVTAFATTLATGVGNKSGILKFNFGKQTFYGAYVPVPGTAVELSNFCKTFHVDRHKGYRTSFINALPKSDAEGLAAILCDSFGFKEGATEHKVVEKLRDPLRNVGHELHYNLPEGLNGPLHLEACEAAGTTLGFLPIVRGGRSKDLLDIRFKIKGFTSSDCDEHNPEVVAFAQGAKLEGSKLVFPSNRYASDATRIKVIRPFKGEIAGRQVTVNVIHVHMTLDGNSSSHWEVTGILDVPPMVSANELMKLVAFTLAVSDQLPERLHPNRNFEICASSIA
jgi:rRNA processing protein Krr1/Pno1